MEPSIRPVVTWEKADNASTDSKSQIFPGVFINDPLVRTKSTAPDVLLEICYWVGVMRVNGKRRKLTRLEPSARVNQRPAGDSGLTLCHPRPGEPVPEHRADCVGIRRPTRPAACARPPYHDRALPPPPAASARRARGSGPGRRLRAV